MIANPTLTVAICTYRRPDLLRITLESLAQAGDPGVAWELLVVDNACEEKIEQLVGEFAGRLPVRYERQPEVGTSNARNLAVKSARAPIVLFTDDDVTFDPNWLSAMVRQIEKHPECAFWGGRIEPVWPAGLSRPKWYDESLCPMMGDVLVQYRRGENPRPWVPHGDPPFYTANLALRVTSVIEVGYFDTSVGHKGGVRMGMEDSLMVGSIAARGGRGWYAADAVVHHPVPTNRLNKRCFRQFAWRQGWLSVRMLRRGGGAGDGAGRVPRWLYRVAGQKVCAGAGRWLAGVLRGDPAAAFAGQFEAVFNFSKLWHAGGGGAG